MGECAKLRGPLDLLMLTVLALVMTVVCLVSFIIDCIRKGPSQMFYVKSRNVRPEILKDSTYGTHEFVRLRNSRMKLHYVINGPKDKPLMLFLHGFPEFWYSWRHQIKEFSKDYRTVACDLRGYGESDKPRCISDYILDKLTDDVDQLITELGYKKCILVAHDWGGAVAWSMAALHPEKVEKLIIGNCPHPIAFQSHVQSGDFAQIKKSWYIFFFQIPFLPLPYLLSGDIKILDESYSGKGLGAKPGSFTPEDMEAFKYTHATCDDWLGPINYIRAIFRYHSPKVEEAFKRNISTPTMMIWGAADGFLEKRMAEMTREYVDQLTIEYIEGASHWIQQDEPEQFNMLTRQFLKKDL